MRQRILFVNNYDMQEIWNAWKEGRGSDTHLWGVNHMQADGLEVRIPPTRGPWPFKHLPANPRWGDSDQQLRAWLSSDYDLLYAGAPSPVMGLGALWALGLFRRPIVAVMHHPPSGGRQPALCLSGFDRILCLSRWLQADLVSRFPRLAGRVQSVEWGPDIDFHRPMEGTPQFLLCEGKTLRDYDTLCLALTQIPIPTRIYSTADCAPSSRLAWVDLRVAQPGAFHETGKEINASYRHSLAVAIPLQGYDMLIGLTSLVTALARGKGGDLHEKCVVGYRHRGRRLRTLGQAGQRRGLG
jgi:hypothetical protein